MRTQRELFVGHYGIVSSNSHHAAVLLILDSTCISGLILVSSWLSRDLSVCKNLTIVSTWWHNMCNLWFCSTNIQTHLLLLSSALSCNTMISLLVTVLALGLVTQLLAVDWVSIWMRAVTVTLSSIWILSKYGILHLLRLDLLVVSIHSSLQRS